MNIITQLSSSELAALKKCGKLAKSKSGDLLITEGQHEDWLGILISGRAQVVRTNQNRRRVILDFLGPGDCFGELAMLLRLPRNASIEALEPCALLKIGRSQYERHCQSYHGLNQALLIMLAERLHRASLRAAQFALLDTTSRVLNQLIAASSQVETPDGPGLRCEIRNQSELAEIVGTSRELVSRALKLLVQTGEIIRRDKSVFIPLLKVKNGSSLK